MDVIINQAPAPTASASTPKTPASNRNIWVRQNIAPIQKFSLQAGAGANAGPQDPNALMRNVPDPKNNIYEMDPTAVRDRRSLFPNFFSQLEEKPWRKPGADISDWFNYGFNEDTWNAYREKQNQIRAMNQMQSKIQVRFFPNFPN